MRCVPKSPVIDVPAHDPYQEWSSVTSWVHLYTDSDFYTSLVVKGNVREDNVSTVSKRAYSAVQCTWRSSFSATKDAVESRLQVISGTYVIVDFKSPNPAPVPWEVPKQFFILGSRGGFYIVYHGYTECASQATKCSPVPQVARSNQCPTTYGFPTGRSTSNYSPSYVPPTVSLFT